MSLEARVTDLESQLAFQDDTIQALSDVLATQQRAVEPLPRQPHLIVMLFVSTVGPPPSPSDGSSVIATNV